MFPKSKLSTVPSDNQAKEKLANYVYEYLVHLGATKTAQSFLQEVHWEKTWAIGEPPGFLHQWWCVFYDLYSAAPERRETFEHSSEAKAFHDYGFGNAGFPNGMSRNPSIASPMPPSGGRPPSSQGIIASDMQTPVSIPGAGMMAPGAHFFPPNHPMPNIGVPGMELMRNRSMQQQQPHPQMRFPPVGGPMLGGNYHPGAVMARRFSQPPSMVHSPGPSGTPQGGLPIMASPGDGLQQSEGTQNISSGQDSFGPNVGGQSSRSPCHGMSQQPAPAFPPPPASENNNNNDQSHNNNNNNPVIMNGGGGGGGGNTPQFSQHQQVHTMEYLPSLNNNNNNNNNSNNMSFEPPLSMKHSPQHHNSMNDAIASLGNNMSNEFCNSMINNGQPSFSPENLRMQQMMQQQSLMNSHHANHLAMQSMSGGGGPPLSTSFMPHPGVPISASPQFPDYAFTSMSQAI